MSCVCTVRCHETITDNEQFGNDEQCAVDSLRFSIEEVSVPQVSSRRGGPDTRLIIPSVKGKLHPFVVIKYP